MEFVFGFVALQGGNSLEYELLQTGQEEREWKRGTPTSDGVDENRFFFFWFFWYSARHLILPISSPVAIAAAAAAAGFFNFPSPFCSFSCCSLSSCIFSHGFPHIFHFHSVFLRSSAFSGFLFCSVSRRSFSSCSI